MNPPPNFSSLGNAALTAASPLCRSFLNLGCSDYHAACRWLHSLPYGHNSRNTDSGVLFEEMRGTCTTKHGVAAELALELGIPVLKYLVFYRLDGSIRQGAEEILSSYNIEYVPTTHCVLGQAGQFIDLTWNNQTGKLKNLSDFDLYIKTTPMLNPEEHETLRSWGIREYQRTDSKLARYEPKQIAKIAAKIVERSVACSC